MKATACGSMSAQTHVPQLWWTDLLHVKWYQRVTCFLAMFRSLDSRTIGSLMMFWRSLCKSASPQIHLVYLQVENSSVFTPQMFDFSLAVSI